MKKKMITAILFSLLIILLFGVPVFAEEPAVPESQPADTQNAPLPEVIISETEMIIAEPEVVTAEPSVEPAGSEEGSENAQIAVAQEETAPNPLEENLQPSETETPEEAAEVVSEEPADTPVADEPEAGEPIPEEEPSQGTPITPATEDCAQTSVTYVVTVSDGSSSVDLTGGTTNSVSKILATLGYDVTDAVISFDPDSVDTNVIYLMESEEGLLLGDNGPFSKADRNLVVYVNGEPVELTVVDPIEIGDKDHPYEYETFGYSELADAFGLTLDGNVRLVSNIQIVGDRPIELPNGSHDLYLNGFTLNLGNSYFNVKSGSALNIYGGSDDTATGLDGIIHGTGSQYINVCGGDVNLYGGKVGTSGTQGTAVFAQSGTVSIYDGSIETSKEQGTAIVLHQNSSAMIYGGSLRGNKAIDFGQSRLAQAVAVHVFGGIIDGSVPANNDFGYIEAVGGKFSFDPAQYLLNGNEDQKWTVSESGGMYTVSSSQNASAYTCVYYSGIYQQMQGAKTLGDALKDCPDKSVIVLLKDLTYNLDYTAKKTVTLDLNGKILSVSSTASNPGSVITVSGSSSHLTLADSAPGTLHTDTSLPHGGIVTGGVGDKSQEAVYRGGGVTIKNGGIFTMNGGTITGNTAVHGGGVYIDDSSSFIMNGGTICNNTAEYQGGGVFMSDKSTFTMNGGKITGNSALVASGVFALGTMTVGGTATVTGNMSADAVTESNVCVIKDWKLLGTQDDFQGKVGVTLFTSASDFTPTTGKISLPSSQIHGIYFTCDNPGCYITNTDGNSVAFTNKYPIAKVITSTGEHLFDTLQNAVNAKGSGSEKQHAYVEIVMILNSEEHFEIGAYQEVVLTVNDRILFKPKDGGRTITVLGKLVLQSGTENTTVLEDDSIPRNVMEGGGICNKGVLQMSNVTIRNCSSTGNGGAVENYGVFEMISGGIINCRAANGGGVYNKSKFIMTGGTICLCGANRGGGVYNDDGAFTMSGGEICENTADYGGGVYNYGIFHMTAGSINNNTAKDGGGVENEKRFTMTGGIISQNQTYQKSKTVSGDYCSAGVHGCEDSDITLGGTARIEDNLHINLSICHGNTVSIADGDNAPKRDMLIYLTILDVGEEAWLCPSAGNITEKRSGTAQYACYFKSDYNGYEVIGKSRKDYILLDAVNSSGSDAGPSGTPNANTESVVVESISMVSLSDVQKSIVDQMLKLNNRTLVTILKAGMIGGNRANTATSGMISISLSAIGCSEENDLTIWYLDENNTLTPVSFELINGNIVIKNGKYGIYVVTV